MSRIKFGTFLAPHHPLGESPTLQFKRDLDLAVYARVVTPGEIRVGDLVAVSPSG